jgi:16S rRNA (guanine966-N2)-methyltransferase
MQVLDLFAGTGALGLEALSRGAAEVVFVENGRAGLELLRANVARLKAEGARVLERDATRLGANGGTGFDLVFLDPPYGRGLGERRWPRRWREAGSRRARWWSGRRAQP